MTTHKRPMVTLASIVNKRTAIGCTHPGCNQKFSQRCNMQRHVKICHTDVVKVISCTHPGCNKTFSVKGNMEDHVRGVHNKIKSFACTHPGCDNTFSFKSAMKNHVRSLIFRTEFAVIHRKVNTKVTSTESPNLSHG